MSLVVVYKWLGRWLPSGGVAQKILTVSSGTAIAYFIALLATPILTRLYTPTAFGILGVYISVLSIVAASPSLSYDKAIPVVEDENTARALVVVAMCCVLATCVLALLLIGILQSSSRLLAFFPLLKHLSAYLWILPLGVLGVGGFQVLTMWAVRQRAYTIIARAKIMQGISQVVIQVGFGLLSGSPWSLLLGETAGRSMGSSSMLGLGEIWRDIICISSRFKLYFQTAMTFWRFPVFGVGSNFINTLGLNAPILVLAMFFDPLEIGLFAVSEKLIAAPVTLLGNSMMQVNLGELSIILRSNPKKFRGYYLSGLRLLNLLGLGIAVLVATLSPFLAGSLLGHQWANVGLLMAVRAPILWAQLVTLPFSGCLTLFDRQDLQLAWDICRLITVVSVLFIGGYLGLSLVFIISMHTIVASLFYVILLLLVYLCSPSQEKGV